jgi:cardiolipin synthase
MTNLPNILTLSRIALVPPFIGLFYVPGEAAAWITFGLFTLAAVTDFFDGWLARRLNQISEFGRILDPIADKLIVAAALVMLAVQYDAPVIPVVAILCRELLIAGLREGLAGRLTLPVSRLGKWKTVSQMTAIALLLIAPAFSALSAPLGLAGEALLWLAAVLTWLSAVFYIRAVAQQWAGLQRPEA